MKTVTRLDPAAANRERVRRHRERERLAAAQPLRYESQDWELFLRPETLPQKAGCEPNQIARVVLKEIVDNGLDTGSTGVAIEPIIAADAVRPFTTADIVGYRVTDGGPGIDPADVPILFAVNRPLLTSKLKRLPLRGMLGNGLRVVVGAVAAYDGTIAVTTRGSCQELAIDKITGTTSVARDTITRPVNGTVVEITLPIFNGLELDPAELSLAVAHSGPRYTGPSQPTWYGPDDLRVLFARVQPPTTTVAHIVRDVFELKLKDDRIAADLTADEVVQLHRELCELSAVRRVPSIGRIGNPTALYYSVKEGVARIGAAEIPYTVECWATCRRAERSDNTTSRVELLVNRSPSVAPLTVTGDSAGLFLRGCGLGSDDDHYGVVATGKRARYVLRLSVIAPFVLLSNDGKTPYLDHFRDAIRQTVHKAAGSAYRAMVKPPSKLSIVKAARLVMEDAYLKASGDGEYPANARQIMYAARGDILRLTGRDKFGDGYFTGTVLPDFIDTHPELCADWDVVYDGRGHFIEPHTDIPVLLGTVPVREYLGERQPIRPTIRFDINTRFPTHGPENRYRNVLFIEKEGFDPLLKRARIAERFDLAVMSTKGMSVVAARRLIDMLVERGVEKVFVLHDFDVSGFSIQGTLGTDSRRYVYDNAVEVVDIGLRLSDVERLDLQSEPVEIEEGSLEAREDTLREHGATDKEIAFLLGQDGDGTKRVELNAMTSDVFVAFLEQKLTEHGVGKVIPTDAVLREHWLWLIKQKLAKDLVHKAQPDIDRAAEKQKPPRNLAAKLRKLLAEHPELPWDDALALAAGISTVPPDDGSDDE